LDERNSPDITQNRNTVIYGHNMSDGSMFASVHDFASSTVFYGTKIEIATEKGIFIYTPFSVHESNAFDNYFETDFVSDEDFLNFCEQMAFISIYETDTKFTKESQLITLSTCEYTHENGRLVVVAKRID
jgi:sortase B